MRDNPSFFGLYERFEDHSAKGEAREWLSCIVDSELFCEDLAHAVPRADGSKGGRRPFDLIFMLKLSVLKWFETI